jgi:cytochrome bd-type quinol oxidase subunit 1
MLKVIGLNEFPVDEQPPKYVRTIFVIKMTLVAFLATGLFSYFVIKKWRSNLLASRPMLLFISISGIIA